MVKVKIERVLQAVMDRSEAVQAAHGLGIPLEDCICAVVRKTLRNLDVNPEQMELWGEEFKQKAAKRGGRR